jgi:glycosyltransferase involved in cell wall biosynthesis
MFETDRIPSDWSNRLNFMDEVWVPTEHSREIFEKYGVQKEKLRVVGEAVDTSFFAPQDIRNIGSIGIDNSSSEEFIGSKHSETREILKYIKNRVIKGTFIILFVGKWEERKGIKLLLNSFYEEFSDVDDVLLVILTSAYHSAGHFEDESKKIIIEMGERLIRNSTIPSNVIENMKDKIKIAVQNDPVTRLVFSNLPQRDLPALYSLSNVLVSAFVSIFSFSMPCLEVPSLLFTIFIFTIFCDVQSAHLHIHMQRNITLKNCYVLMLYTYCTW